MSHDIPRADLRVRDGQLANEVLGGWRGLLEQGVFLDGDEVAAFERAFAGFCGVAHCIGTGSGTDALELALRAVGLRAGDEVIVPANTFVASALAVLRLGAVPVLVDPDPRHHLLDPIRVRERLGPRVRAVMAVHLYGQVAPLEELLPSLEERQVTLVEDAAQTHGATRHGRHAGGFGAVTATSFYPTKNLGAFGTGGAVLTTRDDIAAAVRDLRSDGFTSRLDAVQAVVLRARLDRLEGDNERRAAAAARYARLLWDMDEVQKPLVLEGNRHVWHLYVVQVPERDRVRQQLLEAGIDAGVHYPVPLHLHPALRPLGHALGDFPVAEAAADSVLSLPLHPHITAEDQERVVDALRKALR
ncbi:MAG TPA: DegT/DnrJ/EryC1/StrS family aminotransferase [Acidimicrobiales bacterium]|nr:DegT/DnrJ/EryC1/StrS family aminotransferase [Acidimicrobiales bacterium]